MINAAGRATRSLGPPAEITPTSFPTIPEGSYKIGRLKPGTVVRIQYTGSVVGNQTTPPLRTGKGVLQVGVDGSRPTAAAPSVVPGDKLDFVIPLVDSTYREIEQIYVRVAVKRGLGGGATQVTAYYSTFGAAYRRIGAITLHPAPGQKIAVEAIPHGTALYSGIFGDSCSRVRRLGGMPDGITEGGVSIPGWLGALQASRPCNEAALDKFVTFQAKVV
jgi:hypothetical protein